MAKILVIPDVHLKPWIFDKADKILSENKCDEIVLLGDFVDNFNQQNNLNLYEDTLNRIVKFINDHKNVTWCHGNHDMSYLWYRMETGYSAAAKQTVIEGISKIERALSNTGCTIYKKDNVLFMHGGLTTDFLYENHLLGASIDVIVKAINSMRERDLWVYNSPLWTRPQTDCVEMYNEGFLQVVGHSPMMHVVQMDNILFCDVFSTRRDGSKYGDETFVIVDTITKDYEVLKDCR